MKRILITGSSGFIAHHLVKYFLRVTEWEIYAHYRSSSSKIPYDEDRIYLFQMDLNQPFPKLPKFDYIIHTAANTWVDGSLNNSIPYVDDNVMGTARLLEWIKRKQSQAKICIFSSDEVLGPAKEDEFFKEDAPLKPSSPYSATKACQEMLAHSFAHSFNLDIFIVRPMNVIGEGERDCKFIGKTIKAIKEGKKITLHGTSKDDVASRHWIYAQDVASAIHFLLEKAKPKEIYHIAGEEMDVYTLASKIFKGLKGRDMTDNDVEFIDFHKTRPGHDKRYSLSSKKLKSMGWNVKTPLDDVIKRLI